MNPRHVAAPQLAQITPYHRLMAYFGVGDLHPGGAEITEQLLAWLAEFEVRDVLEIGPGMGLSTQRLLARSYNVVAVERDEALRQRLKGTAVFADLDDALTRGPFDAVFAESVLYGMPLQDVLPKISQALRPGGVLVFCDMIWSQDADATACAHYHDKSLEYFGIAMVPREPLTWAALGGYLSDAGLRIEKELRFDSFPMTSGSPMQWRAVMAALARRPRLAIDWFRHRQRSKALKIPAQWLEDWACLAVKVPQGDS